MLNIPRPTNTVCLALYIRQERAVSGIENVVAGDPECLREIVDFFFIAYRDEDLDNLAKYYMLRSRRTYLNAYQYAYLDCCYADTAASGLNQNSLLICESQDHS